MRTGMNITLMLCHSDKETRNLRRKPSKLSFAMFDSIDHATPAVWDKLAGHEFFMRTAYLRVLEQHAPANMKFRYAMMHNGAKPVGICCFQVVEFTGESFGTLIQPEGDKKKSGLSEAIKNFFKRKADRISLRLLISGNAFSSGQHGFVFSEEVDPGEAFRALADVIYRISRADKLHGKVNGVLVKDFYPGMEKYSGELRHFNYYEFQVEPAMVLDLEEDWATFNDYLNAMSSKYRKRAKTIIKNGAALEVRSLSEAEIRANGVRIMELFDNVHLKAKFRLASLTIDYFGAMKQEFGEDFNLHAYYVDGKMAGFRTTIVAHDHTDAHFVGLDYTLNREHDIYQNILYDYVKEAFARKKKRLFLGRTASEIKSTIGARPVNLYCYTRHRNPLSNRLIKHFIANVKPTEWVQRNPFKEEKAEAAAPEASEVTAG
jgi:hypothetical protein